MDDGSSVVVAVFVCIVIWMVSGLIWTNGYLGALHDCDVYGFAKVRAEHDSSKR